MKPPEPNVLYRVFDRVTRPPILTIYAVIWLSLVALLGVGLVLALPGQAARGEPLVMGDFLAFFTGARVLAQGNGARLYDLALQHQVQAQVAGTGLELWQPYVNPPGLAIVLQPWALGDVVYGYWAYCTAMTLMGILGMGCCILWFRETLAATRLNAVTLGALVLGFEPIARTMFGGQNTVLTFGLLAVAGLNLHRGNQVVAGLALGVLSYKPQYLPLIGVYLLWRRWWVAAALTVLGGLGHYGLGAWYLGVDWPLRMMSAMAEYRPMEWAQNVHTHFSLVPFFDHLVGGIVGKALAGAGIVMILGVLVRFLPRDPERFPLAWGMLVLATMLVSPHLQYYDFGVLVLVGAIGLHEMVRQGTTPSLPLRIGLAVIYMAYPLFYPLGETLGFQPLTIWTVFGLGWLVHLSRSR